MNLKSKIAILIVNSLLCVFIILCTYFFMHGWGTVIKVVCYAVAGAGFIAGFVTFFLKKFALFKSAFVLVVCAAVIVAFIAVASEVGHLNDYETDEDRADALAGFIRDLGAWGMVVYFFIQILQVVVLPLPALVCYVPGVAVYGPLTATLLASAGVIVGSLCCYAIGRFFGKRAVVWIAGKETTEKYTSFLSKRGKVIFVLMQILPFFPDDILCMLAGLTCMNFPFFLLVIVLVRPLIIATYCYMGSGELIPFDQPWGIAVWVVIFAVCIVLAILSFKYQDRVEKWLVEKFSRKKNRGESVALETAEATEVLENSEVTEDVPAPQADESSNNAQTRPEGAAPPAPPDDGEKAKADNQS